MDTTQTQSGVMRVNGEWVTSLAFEKNVSGADSQTLHLKFLKGRDVIAETALPQREATALIGEENLARIKLAIATDADQYLNTVPGTLEGNHLRYRDIVLPAKQANTVDRDAERIQPKGHQPEPSRDPRSQAVPPKIASKYKKLGEHYHFDDKTLAFTDRGSRLTARTENKAVIEDLVAIAKERGWSAIRVRGTESFRQAVWQEATSVGLKVSGFTPESKEALAATPPQQEPSRSQQSKNFAPETQRGFTRSQEAAAAIRSAEITREELQLKYPELNKAVFQHFSAQQQFAEAYIKAGLIRESDRQQVIAQMRDRLAGKVERGETVREPDDSQVNILIRRSVNRVAADIGRQPVEMKPRSIESVQATVRDDAQVRM